MLSFWHHLEFYFTSAAGGQAQSELFDGVSQLPLFVLQQIADVSSRVPFQRPSGRCTGHRGGRVSPVAASFDRNNVLRVGMQELFGSFAVNGIDVHQKLWA